MVSRRVGRGADALGYRPLLAIFGVWWHRHALRQSSITRVLTAFDTILFCAMRVFSACFSLFSRFFSFF